MAEVCFESFRSARAAFLFATVAVLLSLSAGLAHAATPTCGGDQATIVGTSRSDRIVGTSGQDVVAGGGGGDVIRGMGGGDVICGDLGNDTIIGGNGGDLLIGGPGTDSLSGGAGTDSLSGASGTDTLAGGTGDDTASWASSTNPITVDLAAGTSAGDGSDTLAGVEDLTGGSGNDTLSGDDSGNVIGGGPGDDTLIGDAGDDTLTGDTGTDTVKGGDGADRLDSGVGIDMVEGGSGTNICREDGDDTQHDCTFTVTYRVEIAALLRGELQASDGSPEPGVALRGVANAGSNQTITEADGGFSMVVPEGEIDLVIGNSNGYGVRLPGEPTWWRMESPLSITGDQDLGVLRLPKPSTYTVHVVDENGDPLQGARVAPFPSGGSRSSLLHANPIVLWDGGPEFRVTQAVDSWSGVGPELVTGSDGVATVWAFPTTDLRLCVVYQGANGLEQVVWMDPLDLTHDGDVTVTLNRGE
jgi:hypothetical protein